MTKKNASTVVTASAVVALVVINVLASAVLPDRWDWTRGGNFTLSRQTHSVLAGVSQPVKITLMSPHEPRSAGERSFQQAVPMLRELFSLYRQAQPSLSFVEVDPIDSSEGRRLLEQFPDATPPCIVITFGTASKARHEVLRFRDLVDVRGRSGRVTAVDCLAEQSVTAALARLSAEQPRTIVYVLTGHGELILDDIEPSSPRGLGLLVRQLTALDNEVRALDLSAIPRVPADADVVLIAGPTQPYSSAEAGLLKDYLGSGGRALILADFIRDSMSQNLSPTGLEEVLASFGVEFGNDHVVTKNFTGALDAASPALPAGGNHTLVRALPVAPVMLFEARSIRPVPSMTQKPASRMEPLLVSHPFPRAWAEGDLDSTRAAMPGSALDTAGPVMMAAAIERNSGSEQSPELVIVGDAEFASNRSLSSSSGRTGFGFLLSSLHWLRGRADVSADIPRRRHETLAISADIEALRGLAWKSTLFLCAVIVTAGTTVWTARRNG